jgi:hypothetical protein
MNKSESLFDKRKGIRRPAEFTFPSKKKQEKFFSLISSQISAGMTVVLEILQSKSENVKKKKKGRARALERKVREWGRVYSQWKSEPKLVSKRWCTA